MAIQPLPTYNAPLFNASSSPVIPLSPLKREQYALLWKQFGWDRTIHFDTLLTNHSDFFSFLRESRLLYAIRGYQHSFVRAGTNSPEAEPFIDGIKVDMHGHPSVFKEGQWVRWEDLKNEVVYCDKQKTIISIADPAIDWNYGYPGGLTPISPNIEPVYPLNPNELERLKQHSGATEEKRSFIQVFTTESALWKKVSHVGLRLIDELGEVYSFSFRRPNHEVPFEKASVHDFLSTFDAQITSPDFAEFERFAKRRVTTLPIPSGDFEKACAKLKAYSEDNLHFHFVHQNCCTFVADILREVDIPIDVNCWVGEFAWELAKDIPILGTLVLLVDTVAKTILNFFDYLTPNFIQLPIRFAVSLIAYIPLKILTILRNFLILSLGGAKAAAQVRAGVELNWDNQNGLTAFHTLMDNWKDIFRDDIGRISSAAEVVNWQLGKHKEQTFIHPYDGSPSFHIVPPAELI